MRKSFVTNVAIVAAAFAIIFTLAPSRSATAVEAATSASSATQAAAEPVERLHRALIGAMQRAGELGFDGRRDLLAPVIRSAFLLPQMAQIVSGSHWSKFSPAGRDALTEAFTRMTVANYAARFDGYSGEKFVLTGIDPVPGDARLVHTQLVLPRGEPVKLDYLVRLADEGWRIVDIYLRGSYSELATKRSEFTAVLARQGLDGLIRQIDTKVQEIARAGG